MVETSDRTLLLDLTAALEILEPVIHLLTSKQRRTLELLTACQDLSLEELAGVFDLLTVFGSDRCPYGQPICHDFTLCQPLQIGREVVAGPDSTPPDTADLLVRLDLSLGYGGSIPRRSLPSRPCWTSRWPAREWPTLGPEAEFSPLSPRTCVRGR